MATDRTELLIKDDSIFHFCPIFTYTIPINILLYHFLSDHILMPSYTLDSLKVCGNNFCFDLYIWYNFPGGSTVKNPPADAGDTGSLGLKDPLE